MFSNEILDKLKENILDGRAEIIIIQKGNTKKHLILVSKLCHKWQIFNGNCEFPLDKAYSLLGITDNDILNHDIKYSIWNV